jgi:hypothetical protein
MRSIRGIGYDSAKIPPGKVHLFNRMFDEIIAHFGKKYIAVRFIGLSSTVQTRLKNGDLTSAQGKKILDAYKILKLNIKNDSE